MLSPPPPVTPSALLSIFVFGVVMLVPFAPLLILAFVTVPAPEIFVSCADVSKFVTVPATLIFVPVEDAPTTILFTFDKKSSRFYNQTFIGRGFL